MTPVDLLTFLNFWITLTGVIGTCRGMDLRTRLLLSEGGNKVLVSDFCEVFMGVIWGGEGDDAIDTRASGLQMGLVSR